MTGYGLVNLKDMIQELGEGRTKEILSEFSCPLNKDVEFFLHCKAIEFARQGIAQTQLVVTSLTKTNQCWWDILHCQTKCSKFHARTLVKMLQRK